MQAEINRVFAPRNGDAERPEERLRLEDLDAWLARGNGLEHAVSDGVENAHDREAVIRQRHHEQYQENIHRNAFSHYISNSVQQDQIRRRHLQQCQQHHIHLVVTSSSSPLTHDHDLDFTSNSSENENSALHLQKNMDPSTQLLSATTSIISDVPLEPLADLCDTVLAWAMNMIIDPSPILQARDDIVLNDGLRTFKFSLEHFEEESVRLFLKVTNICYEERKTNEKEMEKELTDQMVQNNDQMVQNHDQTTENDRIKHAKHRRSLLSQKIRDTLLPHEDQVVPCCLIAHFLQCQMVLDITTEILIDAVDTDNCLALCQLADQLNLPTLFERSLSHMTRALGTVQDDPNIWDQISSELRDRITTIQKAIQSSVHSAYGSRCNLTFSSLEEYLAIFTEQVQYYRERLAEAREQHLLQGNEIAEKARREIQPYFTAYSPQEDWLEGVVQRHVTQALQKDHSWKDTQMKIERQEKRLQTLEFVLREQVQLFGSTTGNRTGNRGHEKCAKNNLL